MPSNSLVTNFAPMVQSRLNETLVSGAVANTTYVPASRGAGTVQVTVLSDGTVKTDYSRTATTGQLVYPVIGDSKIDIVMDKSAILTWRDEQWDREQSTVEYLEGKMTQAGAQVAEAIDAEVFESIAGEITATAQVKGSDSNAAFHIRTANALTTALISYATQMDNANVPRNGRWIVVPNEVREALWEDTNLPQDTALADEVAVEGYLGRLFGFDIYTSNNIFDDSSGTDRTALACLAGFPGSIEMVLQSPPRLRAVELDDYDATGYAVISYYGVKCMRPNQMIKFFVDAVTA